MKHILFITSTNLASNPRCLKEVRLAVQEGYKVSVIAFEMDNWTRPKEQLIRDGLKQVRFYYIPAGRKPLLPWLMAVMQEKWYRKLFSLGLRGKRITAVGVNRRTALVNQLLKREQISPQLVVAHNPGAFYPACKLAKRNGIDFAIDVEDYHPGEGNDALQNKLQEELLRFALHGARYVSYASEPIMKQVEKSLAENDHGFHFVIDNVFPANDFPAPPPPTSTGRLQLLWFSQNIDASRGLEQLLPGLDEFAAQVELVLVGNLQQDFFQQHLASRNYITIKEPVTQEELHRMAGHYDVGLAIEPGKDLNNKLALSNKMWVYFQSGLYIMATNTEGQNNFIQRYPAHGRLISLERDSLRATINDLLSQKGEIRANRQMRWKAAQQHGWEQESKELVKQWSSILQS